MYSEKIGALRDSASIRTTFAGNSQQKQHRKALQRRNFQKRRCDAGGSKRFDRFIRTDETGEGPRAITADRAPAQRDRV